MHHIEYGFLSLSHILMASELVDGVQLQVQHCADATKIAALKCLLFVYDVYYF